MSLSKIGTDKPPATPGEILLGEFLEPLDVTQCDFAKAIGVKTYLVTRLNQAAGA